MLTPYLKEFFYYLLISFNTFNNIINVSIVIILSFMSAHSFFWLKNGFVEYLTSSNNYYLQYLILVRVLRCYNGVLDNPYNLKYQSSMLDLINTTTTISAVITENIISVGDSIDNAFRKVSNIFQSHHQPQLF